MPKPSRYRQDRAERLALSTYLKLTRASDRLWDRLALGLQREDLTPSQFGVLEALFHLGPMCQRDLGERILRSSGNMTLVVGNLERRGLVRRERSAEDHRYNQVHLTGRGRAAHPPRLPRPRRRHHPGARHPHAGGAAHPGKPLPEIGSSHMSIHHVTAIAGDPQRNLDFYTGPLGLRLVKLTVNFDDPGQLPPLLR